MFRRLLCAVLALVLIVCLLPLNTIPAKAASAMKASDNIVLYLKTMEGFTAVPRWDYVQWTVGYGNRCPDEHLDRYLKEGIPIEEADALFLEQLVYFEEQVNAFIDRNHLTFTQNQFDAVLSITYNCGAAWLTRESDLRTAILNGTTGNALIGIMTQWCTAGGEYLPGLMRRRLTEADMYLSGRYNTQALDNYCYVFFDAGEGKASAVAQGFDCNLYAAPMVTATREGYTFLGWYTAETGGAKVTYLDENLHQSTLYAHWEKGDGVYEDDSPMIPDGVVVTVTGDVLNVRSGPSTAYAVINSAVYGEKVVVTQATVGGDGRLWGRIDKGWICLEYTNYEEVTGGSGNPGGDNNQEEESYQVPVYATIVGTKTVTLYNGPDTGYPKVGSLREGDEVLLVETYKMFSTWWARVEGGGWICLDRYVLLHNDQMLAHSVTVKITNSYLNVRSGPGTQYGWLSSLNKDDVVEILAVEQVGSTIWGRFSGGWISLEYTTFNASKLNDYWHHSYGSWRTVMASTCVTHGTERRTCQYCDHFETRETALSDHTYGEWYSVTDSNCVQEGQERRDCVHCDDYEVRGTELGNHSYGPWQEVLPVTCTEDGLNHRYCQHCDAFEEELVPATGHSLGQWYETVAPTLTEYGQERRDCENCDHHETRDIDPVEHLFTGWYVAQDPTCTEAGQERRDCTDCEYFETRELPALGHAFGEWITHTEESCTDGKEEYRECTRCSELELRIGEAPGHDLGDWYTERESTCAQEGLRKRTCAHCDHYESETIEKLAHTFCDWYISIEPTYEVPGQERRDCTECDAYETRVKEFDGQVVVKVYATITCSILNVRSGPGSSYGWINSVAYGTVHEVLEQTTVAGKIWGRIDKGWICLTGYTTLEEVTQVVGHTHSFGDWYNITEATCTTDGAQRRDCTDCSHYETRIVTATGHNFTVWYTVSEATPSQNGLERRDCRHCEHYEQRETVYQVETVKKIYGTLTGYHFLRIRAGAGVGYMEVGQLSYGDRMEIFEIVPVGNTQWGRIEKGWIQLTGYITLEEVEEPVEHTHSFGAWYTVTEATCTTSGEQRRDCAGCDHSETQTIAATGHSFGAWYTVTEATCTTSGEQRRDCTGCDHSETQTIAATGHSFGAWYTVTEATCTTSGEQRRDCTGCDHSETQTIAATGHSFGDWYTVNEATPSAKGLERRDCQHCDHYEERETVYQVETVKKIYGTLTGYSYLNIRSGPGTGYAIAGKLSRGDRMEILEIIPLGNDQWGRIEQGWIQLTGYITLEEVEEPVEHTHSFGAWYTVTEATCTADGEQRRDCTGCDHSETMTVTATGHSFGAWYTVTEATCTTSGEQRRDCTGCDHSETQTIAATGHSFGDWYTVKEATASENGLERRDCQHCDHCEERETIYHVETVKKTYGTLTGHHYLRIRAGLGVGYAEVGQLTYGERVEIFEIVPVANTYWGRIDRGWIQLTGYITLEEVEEPVGHTHSFGDWYIVNEATASEKGLERRDCSGCDYSEERETTYQGSTVKKVYATITVSSLNVRSGPASSYGWVGYVAYGGVYEVYEQTVSGGKIWGRIDGGWICLTGYTTLEEVVEAEVAPDSNSVKTVTASILNVRAGAGTGYNVVTSLAYGTKVTVLEQKVVGGVTWARVEQGWVSMTYLA